MINKICPHCGSTEIHAVDEFSCEWVYLPFPFFTHEDFRLASSAIKVFHVEGVIIVFDKPDLSFCDSDFPF